MGISVFPAPSGGVTPKVFTYTSAGTDTTFTLPSGYGVGNPLYAEVTILGGGGSAGCGTYSTTSNFVFGGGGGAGGFYQGTIPLTGNMTVRVGRGGPTRTVSGSTSDAVLGGNGGASYIGNGTIKNMFINPAFLGQRGGTQKVASPFTNWQYTAGGPNVYQVSGRQKIRASVSELNSGAAGYGQPYAIKPSTDYCFSIYLASESAQSTGRVVFQWLDVDGAVLSTTNGNTANFTTSLVRVSVGATSPSNAAYVRPNISITSVGDVTVATCPMLQEGVTTPSTYVDGTTSGYKYAGNPLGSPTILSSDTMYIVNGGGGGGSMNSSQESGDYIAGFAGACSGGGGIRISTNIAATSNVYVYAGNGGGLGGNAIAPYAALNSTSTNTINSFSAAQNTAPRYSQYADHSLGTNGSSYYSGTSFLAESGAPGPSNTFGYGKGGIGSNISNAGSSGTYDYNYWESGATAIDTHKYPRPNSGDGGDALMVNGSPGKESIGGAGGSGLVIIKYWS
jgi:hypothetical protein